VATGFSEKEMRQCMNLGRILIHSNRDALSRAGWRIALLVA
jgi:hypothetical protein